MSEIASPPAAMSRRLGRILWFNLACDEDDPSLGFALGWIDAVSRMCQWIDVVTLRVGRATPGDNVSIYSLGRERGFSKPRTAIEFYRCLARLLTRHRYDAAFAHMAPLSAALAFPALRFRGVPILLWYVHPRVDWRLRLAHAAAARVVTCLPTTYPLADGKVEVAGHGIDTKLFRGEPLPTVGPPVLLCAGRISRAKNLHALVRAVATLKRGRHGSVRVIILGDPLTSADRIYAQDIRDLADRLDVSDWIEFHPAVPWRSMPQWYARCRLHMSLSLVGYSDKVALEAMSCQRASLVANAGLRETLGRYADRLFVGSINDDQLAQRIHDVTTMGDEELYRVGAYLRERVVAVHDLGRLAGRLVDLMAETASIEGQGGSLGRETPRLLRR